MQPLMDQPQPISYRFVAERWRPGTAPHSWISALGPCSATLRIALAEPIRCGFRVRFLVNEAITLENEDEINLTRLARIDDGFQLSDISPQFFLADRGRDAATGLALRDGQLIAGFTAGEESAVLATMELGDALATLQPVPPPSRQQ